jgi:NAD(P)-dependent dehydrogenase (short-subunit alcohol dehydrogenase family)
MADVRRAAAEFAGQHPALDSLVNNAGAVIHPRRQTSRGLEAMFAGNYLGSARRASLAVADADITPFVRAPAHPIGRENHGELAKSRPPVT